MEKSIFLEIINPICLHCTALGYACRGLTIKDWIKAKSCENWDYSFGIMDTGDQLYLTDYLVGGEEEFHYSHNDPKFSKVSHRNTIEETCLKDLDEEALLL